MLALPTPYDHLCSSPNSGVRISCSRRIGGACSRPTVCVRVVSASGIKKEIDSIAGSAPDNHFAPGPDCCVRNSGVWGAGEAYWSPCVANTSDRGIRYCGKGVIRTSSDSLIKRSALLLHSLDRRVREQTLS